MCNGDHCLLCGTCAKKIETSQRLKQKLKDREQQKRQQQQQEQQQRHKSNAKVNPLLDKKPDGNVLLQKNDNRRLHEGHRSSGSLQDNVVEQKQQQHLHHKEGEEAMAFPCPDRALPSHARSLKTTTTIDINKDEYDEDDPRSTFNTLHFSFHPRGDFTKAMACFLDGARTGCQQSMFSIGNMYCNGLGVKQDYRKAFDWFLKADEKNYAYATHKIAKMYEEGYGVQKDSRLALLYYEKAAGYLQCPEAMFDLGVIYDEGYLNLKIDHKVAARWYCASAEKGNPNAMYNIGLCYMKGEGVTKDERKAVEWLKKSSAYGDRDSMLCLGDLYSTHSSSLTLDYAEALDWYKKAASKRSTEAMLRLSEFFAEGKGTPKNDRLALAWLEKAAELNDPKAYRRLGICYENGAYGLPKNFSKAIHWYSEACSAQEPVAMYIVGELYEEGAGNGVVPRNLDVAMKWYRFSAKSGYVRAMIRLGDLCIIQGSNVSSITSSPPTEEGKNKSPTASDTTAKDGEKFKILQSLGNPECVITGVIMTKGAHGSKHSSITVIRGGKGDTKTSYTVGEGTGTTQEYQIEFTMERELCLKEAQSWYEKAAEKGDISANARLGLFHEQIALEKDDKKALRYYTEAAAGKHREAVYKIGCFTEQGRAGLQPDKREALWWYKKAAELGCANAAKRAKQLEREHQDLTRKFERALHDFYSGCITPRFTFSLSRPSQPQQQLVPSVADTRSLSAILLEQFVSQPPVTYSAPPPSPPPALNGHSTSGRDGIVYFTVSSNAWKLMDRKIPMPAILSHRVTKASKNARGHLDHKKQSTAVL